MNTLDDLRDTLAHEAGNLHDHDRWARPVAVRERIRVVRRRRTTVAASVAAVVLVGAAAVAAPLLGDPDTIAPAGRVAGVDVPESVAVYGFPYRLADTREAADGHRIRLGDTDTERAVSLAASGLGDGSATLYVEDQPVARAFGDDDVEAPYPIGTGSPTVRVVLDGAPAGARAGVGVYDATGALAPGVDNGTAVFRDEIAGRRLLAAGFSEPGSSSVDLRVRGAMDEMFISVYCTAADDDLWVQVTADGHPDVSSSCGDSGVDAAGNGGTSDRPAPVRDHTLRLTLTRGADGPPVTRDDVTVGLGVYERDATEERVLGMRVERSVEWGGRTWVLDRALGSRASVDTADGDRLLGIVGRRGPTSATWRGRLSRGGTAMMSFGPGAGTSADTVLLAGDRYAVTLRGGDGQLLVYRPS